MSNDLIYVFCILNVQPQPEENVHAHHLIFSRVKEYYVCLKMVSSDEFSEENRKKNFANPDWLKVNTFNHLEVIKAIMKNYSVIPLNSEPCLRIIRIWKILLKIVPTYWRRNFG